MTYVSVKSGKQIKTLLQNEEFNTLFTQLVYKIFSKTDIFEDIKEIISKIEFDRELYDFLFLKFSGKYNNVSRAKKRFEDCMQILKDNNVRIKSLLDIGSDDCAIPFYFAKRLQLKKENVLATDIHPTCAFNSKVTYQKIELFEDISTNRKFNLVTAFQSLHHAQDVKFRLRNIRNLMSYNGVFVIREHDCVDYWMRMLIDVEHLIYNTAFDKLPYDVAIDIYYGNYMSVEELMDLMNKSGFIHLATYLSTRDSFNPTAYYYSIYKK